MVFETVRRARRRFLVNEILRHGVYALSAALLSLILLLLCGAQVLDWRWLLGLPAAALAGGAYSIQRRWPTSYEIAQRVDRCLASPDTLSTALYFATSGRRASAEMRGAQWSQAEGMARGMDVRRAIPIRAPRAIYAAGVLGLIAGSLLALRYGPDHRLNLRPPLARMIQARLGISEAPAAEHARSKPGPSQPKAAGGSDGPAQDAAADTASAPDAGGGTGQPGDQESDAAQPGSGTGEQGRASEDTSLLGKLRDAASSLMSRMSSMGKQASASAKSGGQDQPEPGGGSPDAKDAARKDGQPGEAREGQHGGDSQDAPGGQSGSSGQSAQSAAEQSGAGQSTKQAGSGIGREDGDKDVKLAAQLAAMGKISEIIGKRSANVTGEVTVEVRNGGQQLHTPYSARAARDMGVKASGGEISRDEIPLGLQAYVRQYFEELRKTPTSATPASAPQRPGPSPGHKDSK